MSSGTLTQLYLDRCQVDTPHHVVRLVWDQVLARRGERVVERVVDFGAGDGRFSTGGLYGQYIGYEVDGARLRGANLGPRAKLLEICAFEHTERTADLCIGNPPFVRNQDLPDGWATSVATKLERMTGIRMSGLSNAWQYFFLLALASVKEDGMCALILPYEWVGRPSSSATRQYIAENGWEVSVYRLADTTFAGVLTSSSITIVDKSRREGRWRYFEQIPDGTHRELPSPTGSDKGLLAYSPRVKPTSKQPRAVRGLSPGTQKVLTLTEAQRLRLGLKVGTDVVPCVTTLRQLDAREQTLDEKAFNRHYRDTDSRCWLPNTERPPSRSMLDYYESIEADHYATKTCLSREVWWQFKMPAIPALLLSQGFTGSRPKVVRNRYKVRAVGGVCGIYNVDELAASNIVANLLNEDLSAGVVEHSHGLRKVEIGQLNAILPRLALSST